MILVDGRADDPPTRHTPDYFQAQDGPVVFIQGLEAGSQQHVARLHELLVEWLDVLAHPWRRLLKIRHRFRVKSRPSAPIHPCPAR